MTLYLQYQLLLHVVLLVGLEEREQSLLLAHRAAAHDDGQTLEQGGASVERLIGPVVLRDAPLKDPPAVDTLTQQLSKK